MTKDISKEIIGCAIEVHNAIGPGLLESVYQKAMVRALELKGHKVRTEVPIEFNFLGLNIADKLRIDLLVDEYFIVELKSVEDVREVHLKQLLTYLRLSKQTLGLLINFNVPYLRYGIHRVVNKHYENI